MLLKAGTYRFNDVINNPYAILPESGVIHIPITCDNIQYSMLAFDSTETDFIMGYHAGGKVAYAYSTVAMGDIVVGWQGNYQDHTITTDTEVDDTFGTWYISNTNYNEVNAPIEDKIYIEVASWYKSVADAIRSKKGTTSPILRDDFASEIASIKGGGETPYYDGTVVIEKANSVLGLRRFKDIVDMSNMPLDDEYNAYIPCNAIFDNVEYDLIICQKDFISSMGEFNLIAYGHSSSEDYTIVYSNMIVEGMIDFVGWKDNKYREFTITDQLAEAQTVWLLANTEGVSV